MKIRKIKKVLLVAVLLFLAITSCITPKKVLYLQDMGQDSQIQLENRFEAVIAPYDELSIIVKSFKQEMAMPFNLFAQDVDNSNGNRFGYLVDVNGNIQFPVLGEMHVAGMTRLQLQQYITNLLKNGNYVNDPFVMVRFSNFKIFFLGADGGKALTITNEYCTLLDALALSGDLSLFTKRDKIAVMRQVDGKMTMRYLDPRSANVFNDPYFMLQQNDFIITQSISSKYYREEFSYWASWLSLVTSVSSIITLIMVASK